jgi:hypothetical protein
MVSMLFFEDTVSVRIVSEGRGVTVEIVSVLMVSITILSVVDTSVLCSFLQLRTVIPISKVDRMNFIIIYFVVMVQK